MRQFQVLIVALVLGAAMLLGAPSDAWAWRSGWYGGGWHVGVGPGWNRGFGPVWGWRSGWGPGWGWNRGWGPGYAGLGLGWAATSPYWGTGWNWGFGRPYYGGYYGPSYTYRYSTYPTYYGAYRTRPNYAYTRAVPVVMGRSVATGSIGMHCATPVKACLLKHASYVGVGCSCKVIGGRARGSVVP
jgi:hypothetical protein